MILLPVGSVVPLEGSPVWVDGQIVTADGLWVVSGHEPETHILRPSTDAKLDGVDAVVDLTVLYP